MPQRPPLPRYALRHALLKQKLDAGAARAILAFIALTSAIPVLPRRRRSC